MKIILIFAFTLTAFLFVSSGRIFAASEADCAIWICLPGGFPSGCAAAHRAFRDRVKHGRPPLPELWSCSSGPNGERASGDYQIGREIFESCASGFILREDYRSGSPKGKCYMARCAPDRYMESNQTYCKNYEAVQRAKKNYIRMWVNGDYLGQFWYK